MKYPKESNIAFKVEMGTEGTLRDVQYLVQKGKRSVYRKAIQEYGTHLQKTTFGEEFRYTDEAQEIEAIEFRIEHGYFPTKKTINQRR